MYYDPKYKLFIGFPYKNRYIEILQAYDDQRTTEGASKIDDERSIVRVKSRLWQSHKKSCSFLRK